MNNASYWINQSIESHGAFIVLIVMGCILIIATLLKTAGYFASSAIMVPLRTGIVRDIRIQVYAKVLSLPLSFFSEERKGDIIARMSADVTAVENSLTSSIDMLIRNPIALVVCFITLFSVSWQMTLFVIVILPLAGWVMGVVSRKLKRQSATAQSQWGDIMSQLDETLGGLRVIKAFIAESKMLARFTKTNNEFRDAMNEMVIRQSSAHPMSEFLGTCVIIIVLWFGGALILNNSYAPMDAATFIFYLVILYSIINPLKEFSKAFYNIPLGLASMDRIDMILKAESHIKDPVNPLPLDNFEDKLSFKNVSFSYAKDPNNLTLSHINLKIRRGETIGVIGGTGSAKSSLVQLIPRLYDVLSGSVLVGGHDVREYKIKTLRDSVSMVLQKNVLFSGTIRENLRWGNADATDAQIEEACRAAAAHDFITSFPAGYDTDLGQGGVNVSGGQKQRLCIARALLKRPKIIILDDSTSAVDTATDAAIRRALRETLTGTTTIIIAQRITSVMDADRIVVMDEGQISDVGTHEELMARSEIYREVYESQQKGVA